MSMPTSGPVLRPTPWPGNCLTQASTVGTSIATDVQRASAGRFSPGTIGIGA